MLQRQFALFISMLLLFSPDVTAKKRCKPLLEKLQNIQALQRNGYSSKRGVSLRNREDKARNKWWQCENGSFKKKKTKKKRKGKTASRNTQRKRINVKKISAGDPFKTSNAITIKSKYHGEKKQAWFQFYQRPDKCVRPKSLSVFAYCSENKQIQQVKFEKQYRQ